jgi:hypothetical protein
MLIQKYQANLNFFGCMAKTDAIASGDSIGGLIIGVPVSLAHLTNYAGLHWLLAGMTIAQLLLTAQKAA